MKLYHIEIKFPQPTYARIIGGHPEGSLVLTQGVSVDTLDDSNEPYYDCLLVGNPQAVYPYTQSNRRIFSQSELYPVPDDQIGVISDCIIKSLCSNIII